MKQPEPFQICIIEDANDSYMPSEQVQEFLFGISKGYSTYHSCALAGVSYATMLAWLDANNTRHKPGLLKLFHKAKAISYSEYVDKIRNSRDWRAAAFWLERHEEEFAPKEKGISIVNQVVNANSKPKIIMDPETIRALSEAYDERMKEDEK